MSDLIERLRCDKPIVYAPSDPRRCKCLQCKAADALEAMQKHCAGLERADKVRRERIAQLEAEPCAGCFATLVELEAMEARVAELEERVKQYATATGFTPSEYGRWLDRNGKRWHELPALKEQDDGM